MHESVTSARLKNRPFILPELKGRCNDYERDSGRSFQSDFYGLFDRVQFVDRFSSQGDCAYNKNQAGGDAQDKRREGAMTDNAKSGIGASGEGLSLSSDTGRADLTRSEEAEMSEARDLSAQCTKSETIELGGFHLVDELNAPFVADRPKPRGLLRVPPEVEAAVALDDSSLFERHGIIPTTEDRQRQVNSLTLQYYYWGHDIAYRLTPQGVELLAAGLSEIRQLVESMSQDELLTIKIGQP